MDLPKLPIRVRVVLNDSEEPELFGMEGDWVNVRVDRDGERICIVFLDNDKMPSYFQPGDLVVLGPYGEPLGAGSLTPWDLVEPGTRERLSALAD